jgi:hypothetical protein
MEEVKLNVKIIIFTILFFSSIFYPLISASNLDNQILLKSSFNQTQKNILSDSEYYAIIIGIENFIGLELEDKYIDETAINFYKTLLNGNNWKKENIKLILNENATKNDIKNSIINWLDSMENEDDIILLYFIGHSFKISKDKKSFGNAYILPYDIYDTYYKDDKITDFEINNWLLRLESNHISIVLDTQCSGYMNKLKKFGRVLLTSNGKSNDFFNINDDFNESIFSNYLIKALEGEADDNSDQCISIIETYSYLRKNYIINYLSLLKKSFINKNFSVIANIRFPSIFNLHFGEFSIIFLSFGWKQLYDDGFGKASNYATRGMTIFKDELYIGTQNNRLTEFTELDEYSSVFKLCKFYNNFVPNHIFDNIIRIVMRGILHIATFASEGCELWKYNYSTDTMTQIIGDNSISGIKSGFNYSFNAAASIIKEYNGYLYVGTWNTPIGSIQNPERKGCEIWRSSDGIYWEQVVGENSPYTKGGFGNSDNVGAWCIEEFNGFLYVGTMNWDFTDQGGCEIWRSSDGLNWELVVDHGFRSIMNEENILFEPVNTYAWIMKVFKNQLYVGTFNSRTRIFTDKGTGCQLWRTSDGIEWDKISLPKSIEGGYQDGFGESENYGIRQLTIYNDELYVGVASSFLFKNGCEIWKYDGVRWTPIISDEIPGLEKSDITYDGFGNSKNKYIWSMTATSDGKLWVGTANVQVDLKYMIQSVKSKRLLDSLTDGFEIWCYDNNQWMPIVKNDIGKKSNGIGDSSNLGARSMIEYPENSGHIVVGTFKMIKNNPDVNNGGCELWIHVIND